MANIEHIWNEKYKDFIDLNDFCNLITDMKGNAEEELMNKMESLLNGHVLTLKSA